MCLAIFAGLNINAQIMTEQEKLAYSVGIVVGSSLKQDGLGDLDVKTMAEGLEAALKGGEAKLSREEATQIFGAHMEEINKARVMNLKQEGEDFLAENAKKDGVTTTASGLQYEVLTSGNGKSPSATDQVVAHYHGMLINGKVFDSSVERGQPITLPVNGVIQGWQEALQLMKEGDKWRLYIPYDLAYGPQGAGNDIPPFAALIFDVELIQVK